jgi:hypothetical protein
MAGPEPSIQMRGRVVRSASGSTMRRAVLLTFLGLGFALAAASAASAGDDRFGLRGIDSMDDYLDQHPGVAKSLEKNPGVANDAEFQRKHPGLVKFLKTHPLAAAEFADEPDTTPIPDIEKPRPQHIGLSPNRPTITPVRHSRLGSTLLHQEQAIEDADTE